MLHVFRILCSCFWSVLFFITDRIPLYRNTNQWQELPGLKSAVDISSADIFNQKGYLAEGQDFLELPRFGLLGQPSLPQPPETPRPQSQSSAKRDPQSPLPVLDPQPSKKVKTSTTSREDPRAASLRHDDNRGATQEIARTPALILVLVLVPVCGPAKAAVRLTGLVFQHWSLAGEGQSRLSPAATTTPAAGAAAVARVAEESEAVEAAELAAAPKEPCAHAGAAAAVVGGSLPPSPEPSVPPSMVSAGSDDVGHDFFSPAMDRVSIILFLSIDPCLS